MNLKNILGVLIALLFMLPVKAQNGNPPINLESLFANEGMSVSMSFSKNLQSIPEVGFYNISSIITDWETSALVDLMLQGGITYRLFRGVDVFGGYHYVPVNGVHASTGLRLTWAKDDLIVALMPRFDLYKNHAAELFLMTAYSPNIKNDLNFYSKFQGLYAALTKDGTHERSYAWFRVGLNYKDITFGLGANLDYYGPVKANINNFGVFTSFDLF